MEKITLRDLCLKCNLENEKILKYEENGLIEPVDKIHGCFRTYKQETLTTVRMIIMYERAGFAMSEIKRLLRSAEPEVKLALENQVIWLEQEKKKFEKAIMCIGDIKAVQGMR